MTKGAYEAAFEKAKADLAHAIKERDYWTIESARLEQLVTSLAVSTGRSSMIRRTDAATPDVGFTDIVYSVVRGKPAGMTAIEVRDQLEKSGYSLGGRANPLALIHQTLKRLAIQNKVRDLGNGKYKYISPFYGDL